MFHRAGRAAGDRPQRSVPGHLQHEEEGGRGLAEGGSALKRNLARGNACSGKKIIFLVPP